MNVRRLVKKLIPRGLLERAQPLTHLAEAVAYQVMGGFPARDMKVIGVTGTNGKTTTSLLIHRMLTEAGYKVGLMSTAAYGVGRDLKPQDSHMTTLPAPLLVRRLKAFRSQGVEWLVLETSSHALDQHRIWGVPYSIAVWTNLSHEHLDYHKTFENYRTAKLRLFKLAAGNHLGLQTGIVNADDPSWHYFADAVPNAVTYGLDHGELRAARIKPDTCGSDFEATYKDMKLKLRVNLPGNFNVSNALAAAAVGSVVGLSDEQIARGIAALTGVPGRMERIDEGQNFDVYVDFAVTPDALEKALEALKATAKGRVMVIFGATGDRDKTKRPIMGEIAARLADVIYLTDDETYTEDPESIRQAVHRGIVTAGGEKKTIEIPDRRDAIVAAFQSAKKGDAILLTGMGHFTSRNMGGKEIPWDERQIARDILRGHHLDA